MKDVTRNKILKTASTLFYQKGYNLTGINEIIKEADIAKATLYSHFKSKEDILMAYLDLRDIELLKNIKPFCDTEPEGNPRLVAVLQFLIPFFNQEDFNGCWCIRSIAEVPMDNLKIRARIKLSKQKFIDFLRQLVEENKPQLAKQQQETLAQHIYLLYEGAMIGSHIHNEQWPIDTAIRLLQDHLGHN